MVHVRSNLKNISNWITTPLSYTSDGDLDSANRRLGNLENPRISLDAAKKYVDGKIHTDLQQIKDDCALAFNNYTKAKSTSYCKHIKEYKNLIHEMQTVRNEIQKVWCVYEKIGATENLCMKVSSIMQGDLKTTTHYERIMEKINITWLNDDIS